MIRAIAQRELRSLFFSPLAWLILAVVADFTGVDISQPDRTVLPAATTAD